MTVGWEKLIFVHIFVAAGQKMTDDLKGVEKEHKQSCLFKSLRIISSHFFLIIIMHLDSILLFATRYLESPHPPLSRG